SPSHGSWRDEPHRLALGILASRDGGSVHGVWSSASWRPGTEFVRSREYAGAARVQNAKNILKNSSSSSLDPAGRSPRDGEGAAGRTRRMWGSFDGGRAGDGPERRGCGPPCPT